jgi:hypothetical protein
MTDVPTVRSLGYKVALVVDGQEYVMTRTEAGELRSELIRVLAETKPPAPPTRQSTLAA